MIIVEVQKGNITKALKILSRKVKLTKQLIKIRKGRNYIKKSEQKRYNLKKAKYKQKYLDKID
jgi:small subunit ribosomal protein S21